MMTPADTRRVLDNPHLGWPEDVLNEAYEARAAQMLDLSTTTRATRRETSRDVKADSFMTRVASEVDAPRRGPSWVGSLVMTAMGATIGASLIAIFAVAWGL